MPLTIGLGLGPAAVATARVEIGYVTSYDGRERINDDYISFLIDFHFEDGSKGNLTNNSNNLIVLTQCYAGNYLDNYNDTSRDGSAGGNYFDSQRFTNTTVLAGNSPGKITKYNFACELTGNLWRSRTAQDVYDLTSSCKPLRVDHTPQIQGLGTRVVGGASSTHVLVWASQPDLQRDLHHIERIAQRFPPTANTTVTVLSGNGTAAQTGTQFAGVTYGAATRTNLEDAIEIIGARMDDGPDEQFILFMLDHGGKAVLDGSGHPVPVFDPPTPGARSVTLDVSHEMLSAIRTNEVLCNPSLNSGCQPHVSLFTTLEPGVDFNLGDLGVSFQRPGQPPVPLDALDPTDVFPATFSDGTQRYELRLPLSQQLLLGPTPGMLPRDGIPYTVQLLNWSPVTPLNFDVVAISSGAIPKGEPVLNYPQIICGNDPAFGCAAPLAFFRMNETHAAGTGPQSIVNYAGTTGPTDGYRNFGNAPGSDIGALGPQPPTYLGFEVGNRATEFDGIDDQILIANQPVFNPAKAFSLTAFLNPASLGAGTIVSKSNPTGDPKAFSLGILDGGYLQFRVSQNGMSDPLHEARITSWDPLPVGTWSQVTAALGDGWMNLCVNGIEVARRTYGVPTSVPSNNQPLWIGWGYDGRMDELALWPIALDVPDCEKLADQGMGPIGNAFGFPLTGNGGVEGRTNSPRGVEFGPFDDSGSAFASLDVTGVDVLSQGLNLRLNAETPFRSAVGIGVDGGTTGSGFASLTSITPSNVIPKRAGLAANFGSLGVSTVTVRVLNSGVEVGSFTAPPGALAFLSPQFAKEFGVLDDTKPWGFRIKLPGAAVITPLGGGAPLSGDEIWVTAANFPRSSVPPLANVDVGGSNNSRVEILDAAAGPLPERVVGDINLDGDVDRADAELLAVLIGLSGLDLDEDLDGSGAIGMADLRLLGERFGLPGPELAGATAAPAAPPLLTVETATPAVQVGQPVSLDLVLSGLAGTVGAFALEVRYDAAAFAFQGLSFGSALGNLDTSLDHSIDPGAQTAVFAFDKPGVVQLYVLSLLDAAQLAALQSGTLTLANLDFTALAPATASFDAAAVDMVDGVQPPVNLAPLTQGVQVEVTCANADGDALCNAADNCPFFVSANTADTDGDGRGNPCECGDQTGDGRNDVRDLVAINLAIFNPALATPLCDANGDGACNVNDIIAANVEIFSPGSTSTCAQQPVAGP